MASTFVSLHNHSHYSLLDGLSSPEGLVKRAAELEMPAVALTDHGGMGGVRKLWQATQGTGVKPIVGIEAYVSPGDRQTKEPVYFSTDQDKRHLDVSGRGAYCHLTLLALDDNGVVQLYAAQREAYETGFYRKPRLDKSLLSSLHSVVCLTGCVSGALATKVRLGMMDEAKAELDDLIQIFPDRLFVELMDHGTDFDAEVNAGLSTLAGMFGLPVVLTGDSHYLRPEDAEAHEALLCLQTKRKLTDPNRWKFDGSGFHLGIPDVSIASRNTLLVADMISGYDDVFGNRTRMPRHSSHPHEAEELERRVYRAVYEHCEAVDEDRVRTELGIIARSGYSGYFLIESEIVNLLRHRGVRVGPGRGSAGASIVSYLLGITQIDPIENGLLFERFLNDARKSLPDIDIDYPDEERDAVLDFIRDRRRDNVIQIGTYGTLAYRQSILDSARILGFERSKAVEITKALAYEPDYPFQLRDRELANRKATKRIIELASKLNGTIKSRGIHPAGVIMADSLDMPVWLKDGNMVSEFDMDDVSGLGHCKSDHLGLSTLSVIDRCIEKVKAVRGIDITLPTKTSECTDAATFQLLQSGRTLGIFQLDSAGMRGLLKRTVVSSFQVIPAVLALYRPGPIDNGTHNEYADRSHGDSSGDGGVPLAGIEVLCDVLAETYGLIVYQEQILQILSAVAGYSYGEADVILNAIRKKKHDQMAAARPDFTAKTIANGYTKEQADALWEVIEPFAGYSFAKSHAVGYGLISYWTAYLKANYPAEWTAALLTKEQDPGKHRLYIEDAITNGVDIRLPDVNVPSHSFYISAEEEGNSSLRYGIGSIKGVDKSAAAIASKGPYKSFKDFVHRSSAKVLNGSVFSALVKSGALDNLHPDREGLLEEYERVAAFELTRRASQERGECGLVDIIEIAPRQHDHERRRQLEEETLGVAITRESTRLVIDQPLSEDEWHYLAKLNGTGEGDLTIDVHGAIVLTKAKVSKDAARAAASLLSGKVTVR